MSSRWSLKNTLRLVRGARNAAARAQIKYGKNDVLDMLLTKTMKRLTEAEGQLLEALTSVRRMKAAGRKAA